jgi:hypothetical protein
VATLTLGQIEALKRHDSRGGSRRGASDRDAGRQRRERRAAGVHERYEEAAILALWMQGVVVGVCRGGIECDQQRAMQLAPVRDGIGARLLAERVEVVVGGLEGDERAHRLAAAATRGEHREQSCAVHVPALGHAFHRVCAKHGVGNLPRPSPPVGQLAPDRRQDASQIACDRRAERPPRGKTSMLPRAPKNGGERYAECRGRPGHGAQRWRAGGHGTAV